MIFIRVLKNLCIFVLSITLKHIAMKNSITSVALRSAKTAVRKHNRDLYLVETVLKVNFPSLTPQQITEITDAAFESVPVKL